ncbi:hypothetical protein Tco_1079326 [Tanacetum coccineum]|uniref:Uncharacterized protein n=1 Tax=Tanacetum coccineum TaxID=301880 RepID=A0ABQ5HRJ8_9ASTR
MASMKYCDKHNQVGFLKKPKESAGFVEIVDFLKGSHISAHIDTLEYTITEASVRSKLQLADASGISMLPNTKIFEGMGNIRVYNFSKLIFDGMVANLKSKTKILMYPRFLQMILEIQTENKHPYLVVALTKKIFRNMKRGFRGVPRPLLPVMLHVVDQSAGPADQAEDQPSSSEPLPSTSHPTPVPEPTTHPTSLSPEPDNEPTETPFDQSINEHQQLSPRQEPKAPQSQYPSHPHVPEARFLTAEDLLHMVPTLITKVDRLETELKQTKQTMGKAIVKLERLGKKKSALQPWKQLKLCQRLLLRGKAQMIVEETQALKRTKEQIQQEEASLAEAIRLQNLEEEKTAKQVHLDALLAKRLVEEKELTEQQKQRKAQVKLAKSVIAKDMSEEDFAKRNGRDW